MKTSNIILISFLVFLFGGITLLYIGSNYYNEGNDQSDVVTKEQKIASFSVVVAEKDANFRLKNGNDNKITQTYLKETVPNISSFKVRNDTLFVFSQKPSKEKVKHSKNYTVFVFKNIKSIVAKEKSNVSLKNYQADSLSVKLNKSDFHWDFNKTAYVNIESKNSYLHLNGNNIEKINLQLDKTKVYLNSKKGAKILSGSLINDSYIDGVIVDGKINLEVDKTSKMFFRN